MIENKKIPKKPLNKTDQELLHDNSTEAAQDLDAIFYFVHKRYSESGKGSVPDLGSFLITCAEVVFSDKAKYVALLKKPDRRVLQILPPPTEPHQEELRRIYYNPNTRLPKTPPTIGEATVWIAQLGGFLARKSDGYPGTIRMWKGMLHLADIHEAYIRFVTKKYG